jgi:2-keto-3-deoxy-L-rhamnonate aldolase RhmA
MRSSKTLAKLRAGKTVRMTAMGYFIPPFIRHAAQHGFDCIWLDLEHRAMESREVQALLSYFHMYDVDCMLRAPTLEKSKLYRYLEDGATGLMVPLVSTPEKARMLVDAVKFPPLGGRGLDGAGFDGDFYLDAGADFPERANRETFLVVQIETPEAVENVDAIAAVEGVDGLFVGPADLGLRYKNGPQNGMNVEEATDRTAAAAAKHGKAWGRPAPTLEDVKSLQARGARLLPHGNDFTAFMQKLEEWAKDFDGD